MSSTARIAAIAIIVLVACAILKPMRETFAIIDHPGSCFSCERALPANLKYLGQRSKCMTCEADMISRGRPGEDAHPIRYYET